jgi:hypothetical protein
MSLNIRFIGCHAAIEHLNLRKQGNEDSRILAIDVKIAGEAPASVLNDLLGAAVGDDLSTLFWSSSDKPEEAAALRSYAFGEIHVAAEWPGRLVTLGKNQFSADVQKVRFQPRPGHRLDLTASVSIESPPKHLLDFLVNNLREHIQVVIESQPELDLVSTAISYVKSAT